MRCPECGARGYNRKTKTPEWRCRKCGHEWDSYASAFLRFLSSRSKEEITNVIRRRNASVRVGFVRISSCPVCSKPRVIGSRNRTDDSPVKPYLRANIWGCPECEHQWEATIPNIYEPCVECGKSMMMKTDFHFYGPVIRCTGYPECQNVKSASVDSDGVAIPLVRFVPKPREEPFPRVEPEITRVAVPSTVTTRPRRRNHIELLTPPVVDEPVPWTKSLWNYIWRDYTPEAK